MLSTRSPTLPVTQTAASVTHSVTPRMTKSPVADATLLAALPTASQTLLTTGRSHGFGSAACSARAVRRPRTDQDERAQQQRERRARRADRERALRARYG